MHIYTFFGLTCAQIKILYFDVVVVASPLLCFLFLCCFASCFFVFLIFCVSVFLPFGFLVLCDGETAM